MGVEKPLVNYLDDFLFVALLTLICRRQMELFIHLCGEINVPLAIEKTEWPTTYLTFLGLLIDSINQLVLLPKEKINAGRDMIVNILEERNKKVTIHELQKLAGFLNFLGRAVGTRKSIHKEVVCIHKIRQIETPSPRQDQC